MPVKPAKNINMEPSFFEKEDGENGVQKEQDEPQQEKTIPAVSVAPKISVKPAVDTIKKSKSSTSSEKEGGLAVDVFSSGSFVVVRAFVAGAGIEDIDVSVNQDMVNIKRLAASAGRQLKRRLLLSRTFLGKFFKKNFSSRGSGY